MKHHDYASLFPMLPDAELQTLADDIRENGLQTPITTLDGEILDGRNRHRACEIAGVDPTFEEYLGGDPLGFVVSHNLHRRHLSESQRGMVAAKLATMRLGDNQHQGSPSGEPSLPKKDREQAAADLNIGTTTLDRARRVQRECAPEVIAAVESGDLKLGTADTLRELPITDQQEIAAKGPDALKEAARHLRDTRHSPPEEPQEATKRPAAPRIGRFIPDDAERLWLIAEQHLNKILPDDKSRERVLHEVINYATKRLNENR